MTVILTRHEDDSWTLTGETIDLIVMEKVALRDVLKVICQVDAAAKNSQKRRRHSRRPDSYVLHRHK